MQYSLEIKYLHVNTNCSFIKTHLKVNGEINQLTERNMLDKAFRIFFVCLFGPNLYSLFDGITNNVWFDHKKQRSLDVA